MKNKETSWKRIQKGITEELKHIEDQTKDPKILKAISNIRKMLIE